jgi:putative ABC transport system permease protein
VNTVFARVRSFVRGVRRPTQWNAEMDEEMRFHIEMEAQRLVRDSGLAVDEARRRAAIAFGGLEKYKGAGRDARGITWVLGTSADFKLGLRMLVKYPGLTTIGVIALAVAIGAGAAYLEFINDIFRPSLAGDAARIVGIQHSDNATGRIEHRVLHDFGRWQGSVRSIEHLGAFTALDRNLITDDGRVEPVRGVEISAAAFRVLPTPPLLGRPLIADDERLSAAPVVLIGFDLWQSRFGADPAVVGKAVRLGAGTYTVVGVMPQGFGFPVNHSLWVPLRANALNMPRRAGPPVRIFGRLASDASLEEAQAELSALAASIATVDGDTALRPHLRPHVDAMISANGEGPSEMIVLYSFNIFFLALLAVCGANVATLVFARTATRENEITVRTALGASRGRIVGQLFAEALVLSLIAAAVGLVLASALLDTAVDFATRALQQPAPFWWNKSLSLDTVLYSLALAAAAAAIVGIVPALKATSSRMQMRLKHAGATGSNMRFGGMWTGVIVGQVALTVLFLMTVVSLGWNAYTGRTAPKQYQFPRHEYVSARVDFDQPTVAASQAQQADQHERFTRAVRSLERELMSTPGVASVTFASAFPGERHGEFFVELDGVRPAVSADPLWVRQARVAPSFFAAFGARIVSGRAFTESDAQFDRPVVIVDETFVRTVMGGRDPVGLHIRQPQNAENPSAGPWLEVVGVVRDLASHSESTSEDAVLYQPMSPVASTRMAVHVDGVGDADAAALSAQLRGIAAGVDASLRVNDMHRLDATDETDSVFYRFMLGGLSIIGAVALLLAVAGVYSLMSFTLARRTAEIGIRAALGAAPRRIVGAVFSRAFTQVGLGLLVGSVPGVALVAYGGGEVTRGGGVLMGFGSAVAIALFIIIVTAAACAGPTLRALRIQPTEALRADR